MRKFSGIWAKTRSQISQSKGTNVNSPLHSELLVYEVKFTEQFHGAILR